MSFRKETVWMLNKSILTLKVLRNRTKKLIESTIQAFRTIDMCKNIHNTYKFSSSIFKCSR